jgi:hypothetical protein
MFLEETRREGASFFRCSLRDHGDLWNLKDGAITYVKSALLALSDRCLMRKLLHSVRTESKTFRSWRTRDELVGCTALLTARRACCAINGPSFANGHRLIAHSPSVLYNHGQCIQDSPSPCWHRLGRWL